MELLHRAISERRYRALNFSRLEQPINSEFMETFYFNESQCLGRFYLYLNNYLWGEETIENLFSLYLKILNDGWIFTKTKLQNNLLELFLREFCVEFQLKIGNQNPLSCIEITDGILTALYTRTVDDFKKQQYRFKYTPLIDDFKKQVDGLKNHQLLSKENTLLLTEYLFNKKEWDPNIANTVFSFSNQYSLINVPSVDLYINSMMLNCIIQINRRFTNGYTLNSTNSRNFSERRIRVR